MNKNNVRLSQNEIHEPSYSDIILYELKNEAINTPRVSTNTASKFGTNCSVIVNSIRSIQTYINFDILYDNI